MSDRAVFLKSVTAEIYPSHLPPRKYATATAVRSTQSYDITITQYDNKNLWNYIVYWPESTRCSTKPKAVRLKPTPFPRPYSLTRFAHCRLKNSLHNNEKNTLGCFFFRYFLSGGKFVRRMDAAGFETTNAWPRQPRTQHTLRAETRFFFVPLAAPRVIERVSRCARARRTDEDFRLSSAVSDFVYLYVSDWPVVVT